ALPRAPAAGVRDITEQGFAQAFARAYLSWDARRPDQHQRQVAAFLSAALDGDGGLQMPPRGRQQVLWSAAVQDQTDAHGDRVITVAVQTTRQLLYLAVPVHRTRRGFLVVPRYPALVGPPVSDPGAAPAEERDVGDGALRAVAQRAVTNYLAGQRTNLLADLDPAAVVSLPTTVLDVRSVRSITKAAGDRVAVEVAAADDAGIQWTLRYELTVVHRDRWYVRAIEPDPVAAGGRP
ncbi:MAG: conjugal transfer protein, partial [Solirubrobacteraceae bacterium]